MENKLIEYCNEITTAIDRRKIATTIYSICHTITPQFYKSLTADERRMKLDSIAYLFGGIRQDIIAKMCELAFTNYPKARARDSKIYFDENYILTFYDDAWDEAKPRQYNWYIGGGKWAKVTDYPPDAIEDEPNFDIVKYYDTITDFWIDDRLKNIP
jgi:hypothetical protein